MIYFTLAGNRTNDVITNSLFLMSKNRGNLNDTAFHNNKYSTILKFKNDVFKEYFKYDPKTNTYKQIKQYNVGINANNLPFKYEVVNHNY